MRKFAKWIYEAYLMLQHRWFLFLVSLDPVARDAKSSPEESAEIWRKIQQEIRTIEEQN